MSGISAAVSPSAEPNAQNRHVAVDPTGPCRNFILLINEADMALIDDAPVRPL